MAFNPVELAAFKHDAVLHLIIVLTPQGFAEFNWYKTKSMSFDKLEGMISNNKLPDVPQVQVYQAEFVSALERNEPVMQEFTSFVGSSGSNPPPFNPETLKLFLLQSWLAPPQSAPAEGGGVKLLAHNSKVPTFALVELILIRYV